MQKVIALLTILTAVSCMRDVEEVEWNRYGYLVKVLHEAKDKSKVLACTGTFDFTISSVDVSEMLV
ncbi:hypothetical protein KIN20_025081 [Parelaphostrongylus tenuis]|uniref:Uncharacterized protein n=1 Tax=Parelaphostrongylus tenuis TaxID=148309 RepID=A0AAD5MZ18_PARTN|nr:hypothetical protein KIN20_025081 [Parelaphostrongylus tenuis]